MKKVLSIFTLLIFFFIGFIHNSMMVFAAGNNIDFSKDNYCCTSNSEKSNKKCLDICCVELNIDKGILLMNSGFLKKNFKLSSYYTFISTNTSVLYSFYNKKLINKTSPPFYNRIITNYSYCTLIKIIKSNT